MTDLSDLEVPGDGRLFVNIDENGVANARQVTPLDLDYSALTGFKTTTTNALTVQFGIQYFYPATDDDRLRPGVILQLTATGFTECWMWGIALAKDSDGRIKFAALRVSPVTGPFNVWEVQIVSGPLMGFSPDATIGISGDEMAVPALGQTVEANILADKLVERNTSLLFSDATNLEGNYFRIRVLSYDEETGDVEGVVTAQNGSATSSAWIVSLIPGPPTGGSAPPTSITKVAEATSQDSADITCPTVQAGDLIVLGDSGFTASIVVPTGFTVLKSNSVNGVSPTVWFHALYAKIANGTESGGTITGSASGHTDFFGAADTDYVAVKSLAVFRGDNPAGGFSFGGVGGELTASNPSAQVVAASGGAAPLVVIGAYHTFGGTVNPRTFSTTKDGEVHSSFNGAGSDDSDQYLAWKIYNAAPADSSIDMDDEGSFNALSSCYIELLGLPNEPGDTVVFENDGSDNPLYPEGDGSQITNLDPTALSGAVATNKGGTGLTAIGTARQIIRVNSAANALEWANQWLEVFNGSVGTSTVLDTAVPPGFSDIQIYWTGVSNSVATRQLRIQFSTDGGSSYDTTATNYLFNAFNNTGVSGTAPGSAASAIGALTLTAAQTVKGLLIVGGYKTAGAKELTGYVHSSVPQTLSFNGMYEATAAITHVRLTWDNVATGVFDAGTLVISVK